MFNAKVGSYFSRSLGHPGMITVLMFEWNFSKHSKTEWILTPISIFRYKEKFNSTFAVFVEMYWFGWLTKCRNISILQMSIFSLKHFSNLSMFVWEAYGKHGYIMSWMKETFDFCTTRIMEKLFKAYFFGIEEKETDEAETSTEDVVETVTRNSLKKMSLFWLL